MADLVKVNDEAEKTQINIAPKKKKEIIKKSSCVLKKLKEIAT